LYRGRFAPSPTGPLHLGSLTTALGSWLMARQQGGEWLVRIEDLDPPREIPGMAERHIAELAAFGMVSDRPVIRQSERDHYYIRALSRLREQGHAFACRCSRSDLASNAGIHRSCVSHPSAMKPSWRLRVGDEEIEFLDRIRGQQRQSLRQSCGDFVLRRADDGWAYQLAVVVDDGEQGITDIVRGADLIDSTARQILLQRHLGLATPRYVHLPTVLGADGNKLSKSLASTPIDPLKPLPSLRIAWALLGQDAGVLSSAPNVAAAMHLSLASFDPDRIPAIDTSPAV
jgi:glutamyl-Q tRNA(Asp) synthetase